MADVEISYKGEQIASMNATGVKTLLTSAMFCEDDIVVEYTKPSGGGSSNVKIGTFTGDADGEMTIDLGYTGNGYPIALYIFASSGKQSGINCLDLYVKRLTNTGTTPSYSGAYGQLLYRQVSSGGQVSDTGNESVVFTYPSAYSGVNLAGVFSDKSTLKVYIGTTNVNFANGVQYTYIVAYSE